MSAPWNSLILAMHHDGAKFEGVSKKKDMKKKKNTKLYIIVKKK